MWPTRTKATPSVSIRIAAEFGISRNSVSQIKTRVERMVAAIEAEL